MLRIQLAAQSSAFNTAGFIQQWIGIWNVGFSTVLKLNAG